MKENSLIAVDHLSFNYGTDPVLRNVHFQMRSGEFLGIIGPNGGGKTTLLKLILGFLKPTSGEVKVFGENPITARAKMAYVPQGLRFDRQFPISVKELVLTGRLNRLPWYGVYSQADYAAVDEALAKVGISNLKNQAFGTLSGGQAQRALIARALVSEPKLMLLDEPTASVDPQAEADIYRILQSLRDQLSVVMVTHDLRAAVDLVDRVLLVQGEVVSMYPQQVCEHFALGLYHTPLPIQRDKR